MFQSVHSRAEYEKALPDLVVYYRHLLPPGGDLKGVSRQEHEWRILHRARRNCFLIELS